MTTSRLIAAHLRRLSLLHSTTTTTNHHSLSSFTAPFRHFSTRPPPPPPPRDSDFTHQLNSLTESDLRNLGFHDGGAPVPDVPYDSILPIRHVVSLLDGYHDLSGLPWWIIIASSTVALRITLLPWLILQLKKLQQIGESFPKLPPPFPPPFSGKSFVRQFSLFRKERKALGCPSFLWFLGSYTVQIPCFIMLMASFRSMSLNHHPGFDTGGILWFQNLTELPSGVLGPILPTMIAGLHFCNIQVSFRSAPVRKGTGWFDKLANYYRRYLEILTLPLLFTGFYLPQGSLVYWVTNSSLTLIQQLSLQHPTVRQKIGLPDKEALRLAAESEENRRDRSELPDAPRKPRLISGFSLSPRELVDISIAYLANGKTDRAVNMVRLALDKDPECFRALTVMGQILMQRGDFEEATEYFNPAISKITLLGETADGEAVDNLIQASVMAGAAYYRQGKLAEALVHFERVRDMEEPEDRTAKARYYEGLVILASVLCNEGRRDEAGKYLRMAASFDPEYATILKNFENDTDFVGELVSSRRGDY